MECSTRCCTAWNVRAGFSRGGARRKRGASESITPSKRAAAKPWRSSAGSGLPFRGCFSGCGRRSMFDLDHAILSWRQQMLNAGIKPSANLDELESHLREDVERLTKAGKMPSEAFELALRNLGNATTIGREFAKSDGCSTAMEQLRIGIAAAFVAFILFLSTVSIWLCFAGYGERMVAAGAVISILL